MKIHEISSVEITEESFRMIDIRNPRYVEIVLSDDRKKLWIDVDSVRILRITKDEGDIKLNINA